MRGRRARATRRWWLFQRRNVPVFFRAGEWPRPLDSAQHPNPDEARVGGWKCGFGVCISRRRLDSATWLNALWPLAAVPPLPGQFSARAGKLFGCGPKETSVWASAQQSEKTSSLDLKPTDLKPTRITTPHPFPKPRTNLNVSWGVLPKHF